MKITLSAKLCLELKINESFQNLLRTSGIIHLHPSYTLNATIVFYEYKLYGIVILYLDLNLSNILLC